MTESDKHYVPKYTAVAVRAPGCVFLLSARHVVLHGAKHTSLELHLSLKDTLRQVEENCDDSPDSLVHWAQNKMSWSDVEPFVAVSNVPYANHETERGVFRPYGTEHEYYWVKGFGVALTEEELKLITSGRYKWAYDEPKPTFLTESVRLEPEMAALVQEKLNEDKPASAGVPDEEDDDDSGD